MRRWLVVMAKAPRAGRVKTRLAADIGVAEATRFYRTALSGLIRRLGHDPRWTTVLAVDPDPAADDPVWGRTLSMALPVAGQGRGELGQRMQRIMDSLPPGPAVIVGSDIPAIRPEHIAEAFRLLGDKNVVFGPAPDGGYWLVGQKRRPRVARLFENVRWSTSHALADTLRNCAGLDVGYAQELSDIDGVEDWRRWRRES